MRSIEILKEKDAVLIPIKKWEKVQSELVRLRKKVRKAQILDEIRAAIISVEADLKRDPKDRKITKTADEFLLELENGK